MICTACEKAPAVVFIKKIINNQVSLTPFDPLQILLQNLAKPSAPRVRPGATRCPGCGVTWSDFRSTGRFGCPRCYEHFSLPLQQIMPRIHSGAYAHRGKAPPRAPGTEAP